MSSPIASMDRRSLLTALFGACVVAGTIGGTASSVVAAPRATPPRPEAEATATAEAGPRTADGEAKLHNAQYIVIRRRPRRRWIVRRPIRRRRRVFFY